MANKPFYELMLDIEKKQIEQNEKNAQLLLSQKSSDEVNAAILLNQMDIMTKQAEMDAVLAEILLNGLGV